jgi:hypothetical protein
VLDPLENLRLIEQLPAIATRERRCGRESGSEADRNDGDGLFHEILIQVNVVRCLHYAGSSSRGFHPLITI